MEILKILLCIILMFLFPLLCQWNTWPSIDGRFFKKIKIKRFKFLFRTNQSEKVDKDGIIVAMFVYQVLGYALSIISIVIALALSNNLTLCLIILSSILLIECLGFVILASILSCISKKRKSQKEETLLTKKERQEFKKLSTLNKNKKRKKVKS